MILRLFAGIGIIAIIAAVISLLRWTEPTDAFTDAPDDLRERARKRLEETEERK